MTKLPTKLAPRLVPFRAETETETETDTELARPKRTLAAPTNLRYGSEKIERERERACVLRNEREGESLTVYSKSCN